MTVRRVESLRPGALVCLRNRAAGLHFTRWREFIRAGDGVMALIESEDGHPALLTSKKGAYLAGWPSDDLLSETIALALDQAGMERMSLPETVRIRDHGGYRYIFNYGEDPVDIGALTSGSELIVGATPLAGAGVAVLRKAS